jgi:CTP:molybdopterin cytidylyltransferase MocA
VIGLVLAAGAGRRYGAPKAGVVLDGERLVDRAVRVLTAGGASPVLVVLGAQLLDVAGATVVVNPAWESGMGSSLAAGLRACAGLAGDTVCVTLVDLPGLTPAVVAAVAAESPDTLTAATYDGVRGHPVVLGRHHWQAVAASVSGDRGARDYLNAHADELRLVEVAALGSGQDLDSPTGGAGTDEVAGLLSNGPATSGPGR